MINILKKLIKYFFVKPLWINYIIYNLNQLKCHKLDQFAKNFLPILIQNYPAFIKHNLLYKYSYQNVPHKKHSGIQWNLKVLKSKMYYAVCNILNCSYSTLSYRTLYYLIILTKKSVKNIFSSFICKTFLSVKKRRLFP